jgi:hypothetical protein
LRRQAGEIGRNTSALVEIILRERTHPAQQRSVPEAKGLGARARRPLSGRRLLDRTVTSCTGFTDRDLKLSLSQNALSARAYRCVEAGATTGGGGGGFLPYGPLPTIGSQLIQLGA